MELKEYKLGDIAEISTGYPFDGNLYAKEGIRVLRGENIGDGILKWDDRIDKRWNAPFSKSDVYTLCDGDIVMQMDGNVGRNKSRVFAHDLPMLIAQRVGCIRAKKEIADQDFLYYVICSERYLRYINKVKTGTSIHHISLSQISNYTLSIPPLITQKRIADVLSSFDKQIALNKQINQNLEALARQLYDYWFVQFDFPNEEGKPYKSSGGKMVYNPILKREIPEGWEYVTANAITNVVTGKEDANFSTPDGKYPFFTCSRENLLCSKAAFSGKAILIAGNGDFNVKHYNGEFNAYQRTYVLIPNDEKYYGVLYFSATGKIDIFRKGANGSIVKFITKGDVEQIGVFNCKNENLYRFINNLILQIENNNAEILSLTKQRDELLPLLMNGQVNFDLLV